MRTLDVLPAVGLLRLTKSICHNCWQVSVEPYYWISCVRGTCGGRLPWSPGPGFPAWAADNMPRSSLKWPPKSEDILGLVHIWLAGLLYFVVLPIGISNNFPTGGSNLNTLAQGYWWCCTNHIIHQSLVPQCTTFVTEWCIVGYISGVLWDLWNGSLWTGRCRKQLELYHC